MRFSRLIVIFLTIASLAKGEARPQAAPKSEPSESESTRSQEQSPHSADSAPAVDAAKVTGSTFDSQYFKFTYELPKGWKALADAERVGENKKLSDRDKEASVARLPAPKRGTAKTPVRKNPTLVAPPASSPERYSLMVASPDGVLSLESPVLPRINVWAHRRVPPLDSAGDHAQFLRSGKRTTTIAPPQEVTLSGHSFVRVDVITPNGTYQSQFVTVIGDYLVGFDFRARSEKEMDDMADSTKTIKFQ
jgi:hypothetical protein